MTVDDVGAFAMSLPGVTVGTRWGNLTWLVKDKGFAWERPLSKADLKRLGDEPPPKGDIVGVKVESLDAKDALLSMAPPGFFTIAHFQNYPAILIELRKARVKDVKAALLDAYQLLVAALPVKRSATRAPKPRRSPAPRARTKSKAR